MSGTWGSELAQPTLLGLMMPLVGVAMEEKM